MRLSPDDCVLEIGPGRAALTRYLLQELPHLAVVELDRDLVAWLRQQFPASQLTVYSHDVLNFDLTQITQQERTLRVVGNLPYNISTPLLFHLFAQRHLIKDMHFMLQKEVVQRLCAPVGDHHYSRLSVMAQYYCEMQYLFNVGPQAFTPAPKVDSAVVRLVPHQTAKLQADNLELFSDVVREAFSHRRKTMSNALKSLVTVQQLHDCVINPQYRPQQLTVLDYVRISNFLNDTLP